VQVEEKTVAEEVGAEERTAEAEAGLRKTR